MEAGVLPEERIGGDRTMVEATVKPELSIVLPFYNEEGCAEQVLREVHSAMIPLQVPFEIIAVQNGSSDRTAEILQRLAEEFDPLRVLTIDVNQGFGYGLLQGMRESRGDILVYMPGDGQIDPTV